MYRCGKFVSFSCNQNNFSHRQVKSAISPRGAPWRSWFGLGANVRRKNLAGRQLPPCKSLMMRCLSCSPVAKISTFEALRSAAAFSSIVFASFSA